MQKIPHRRAANSEQVYSLPNINHLSWDDLRIFLACADTASFRKAASKLRVSDSTVVRRIDRLECALDARLFDRLPDGVALTAEGRAILASARTMERAICDVVRKRAAVDPTERGPVAISITEGLGSYWVMPRLVEFQREHPFMLVDLRCAMESADVLRLEADMAVQFQRPTSRDLIAVKLARLHVYPFASKDYLNIYGTPSGAAEMMEHRLVQQHAPHLDDDAWARFLGVDSVEDIVSVRTNASTAHFYAVEKGAGIGVLPTFAVALDAPVVPVDLGASHHLDIWLTYHPDIRRTPRKAMVIDWLKRIFDPAVYPWFRDEFIHPNDLIKLAPPETTQNVVKGYFAATPFKA